MSVSVSLLHLVSDPHFQSQYHSSKINLCRLIIKFQEFFHENILRVCPAEFSFISRVTVVYKIRGKRNSPWCQKYAWHFSVKQSHKFTPIFPQVAGTFCSMLSKSVTFSWCYILPFYQPMLYRAEAIHVKYYNCWWTWQHNKSGLREYVKRFTWNVALNVLFRGLFLFLKMERNWILGYPTQVCESQTDTLHKGNMRF